MAVYGRLKRRPNVKKNVSFSPEKHLFQEVKGLPLSIPSYTNLGSSFSHDEMQASSQTDYEGENEIEKKVILDFPIDPPFLTKKKSSGLDSVFKGFENLEDEDFSNHRPKKMMKVSRINELSNCRVESSGSESPQDYFNDDFTDKVTSSLRNLNRRISELQSEVNVKTNSMDLTMTLGMHKESEFVGYLQDEGKAMNHYGNTRSYRQQEKSLSEEESSDEIDEAQESSVHILSEPKTNTKSLQELKKSTVLENARFEFEMILDRISELLKIGGKDEEFLIIKLDLLSRIHSDPHFRSVLFSSLKWKTQCSINNTLKELLLKNSDFQAVNLHLACFISIPGYENNILEQIKSSLLLEEMKMHELLEHVEKTSTHRLLKEMVKNYHKAYPDVTTFQIANQLISNYSLKNSDLKSITRGIDQSVKSAKKQL